MNILEIKEFVNQFKESYTREIIEDDVISFYNDALIMLNQFNQILIDTNEIKEYYADFIDLLIKNSDLINQYTSFDFNQINSLENLKQNTHFKNLTPIYTSYSFAETEEAILQILEELPIEKEFQKELKNEIKYLLEEYQFHLDHIKENMQYNFYMYN